MTVKDKYYIRVKSTLVEVTHEVYLAFYRAERQERNQVEKESRNHVTSYAHGTIRVSFGRDNEESDAVEIAKAIVDILKTK